MGFLALLGNYFVGVFKGLFGQLKTSVVQFLHDFVATDLGALALDAVAYVDAELSGVVDKVAKRDAAVAKFKVDAAKAGHDVSTFGQSLIIFFIESAYQAFQAKVGSVPVLVATPVVTVGQ